MIIRHSYGIIPVQKTPEGHLFLLVCNHGGKHWGFPKGTPKDGETPADTAMREFREETGLIEVRLIPEAIFTERYPLDHDYASSRMKTVTYTLGVVDDPVRINGIHSDISGSVWLPYDAALARITYPESRAILMQTREFLDDHAR